MCSAFEVLGYLGFALLIVGGAGRLVRMFLGPPPQTQQTPSSSAEGCTGCPASGATCSVAVCKRSLVVHLYVFSGSASPSFSLPPSIVLLGSLQGLSMKVALWLVAFPISKVVELFSYANRLVNSPIIVNLYCGSLTGSLTDVRVLFFLVVEYECALCYRSLHSIAFFI